jgi:hypothetical protein
VQSVVAAAVNVAVLPQIAVACAVHCRRAQEDANVKSIVPLKPGEQHQIMSDTNERTASKIGAAAAFTASLSIYIITTHRGISHRDSHLSYGAPSTIPVAQFQGK